ncbi:hypothetical protein LSAT2_006723 [Lamellibrachia satsuma]|nr:hypothetical protein LSAT2_006723 [Lamellibrachia satsuma]
MLAVVVLLFGICWLPLHVFILLIDFHPELIIYQTPEQEKLFIAIYYCVHWLAMSNSFVNPIVYGFLNESFRVDLKRFLRLCFPCCACLNTADVRMLGSSMGPISSGYYERKLSCSTRMSDPSRKLLNVRLTSQGQVNTRSTSPKNNFHRRRPSTDSPRKVPSRACL